MTLISDSARTTDEVRPLRVGLRADASETLGGGHVMRCLALATELRRQGAETFLISNVDGLAWLREEIDEAGQKIFPGAATPDELVLTAYRLELDTMVLDSYTLTPEYSQALRSAGVLVTVIVDGTTRGQSADLVIDQAPGVRNMSSVLPGMSVGGGFGGRRTEGKEPQWLGGFRHALIRDAVFAARDTSCATSVGTAQTVAPDTRPHILCFFGATDPYGAAPTAAAAVLASGLPLRVTVVAARPELQEAVGALPLHSRQTVRIVAPIADLPRLMQEADVVVTAAGSSVLDLLCLGRAVAVLFVSQVQKPLYQKVVGDDLVVGLGSLDSLRLAGSLPDPAAAALRRLVADRSARDGLARSGRMAVDGLGCMRVARVLLRLAR